MTMADWNISELLSRHLTGGVVFTRTGIRSAKPPSDRLLRATLIPLSLLGLRHAGTGRSSTIKRNAAGRGGSCSTGFPRADLRCRDGVIRFVGQLDSLHACSIVGSVGHFMMSTNWIGSNSARLRLRWSGFPRTRPDFGAECYEGVLDEAWTSRIV